MKRTIWSFIIGAVLMIVIGIVYSATPLVPYLVTDPMAGVEEWVVIDNGVSQRVTAKADGSLEFPLLPLADGVHNITIAACNMWGCNSTPTVIPQFTKGVPGAAVNPRIIRK